MIRIENNDKAVIKELKRRGLYARMAAYTDNPKHGDCGYVYAMGDVKDKANKDVFMFFYDFPEAKDNGWQWARLTDGSQVETQVFDEMIAQQVGEYEVLWTESKP